MKYLAPILFLFVSLAYADNFENEARALAQDLKAGLMKNLSEKISKEGVEAAVPFCHENVRPIAKSISGERSKKFEFGRSSHKVRNKNNTSPAWMAPYLKEFQGKQKGEVKKSFIIHTLEDSKRVYLEPLYVEARCLQCHGENISKNIKNKIRQLYPEDNATGFKLGEFRGFIWIKEK
jgi:hypothetical protein